MRPVPGGHPLKERESPGSRGSPSLLRSRRRSAEYQVVGPVLILELIVDLLDGWQNTRSMISEPSGDTIARTLKDALEGVRLPRTRQESEMLFRSLPALFNGGERPESSGSWAQWRLAQGTTPILGVVEVSERDPGCSTAADLINSLKANEEEWVATGFIESNADVITWIVGFATEPAEWHMFLCLVSGRWHTHPCVHRTPDGRRHQSDSVGSSSKLIGPRPVEVFW